jgi:WhiB family redox-sensing transcriptional regulator
VKIRQVRWRPEKEERLFLGSPLWSGTSYDFLVTPPQWSEGAVCAQTDPEVFYPDKGGSTTAAKRICRGCPVMAECLQYAVDNRETFGVWGGLSPRERQALRGAA